MSYTNPILRGLNPDPSLIRVGDDFYCVTSTMFMFPGCPIYHSRDLVNWRLIGHALHKPSQYFLEKNNARPMMYAATIRHHAGVFYVACTDVHGGGNFFVTSRDPAGEWSDPICVDQPCFDPSLFFDLDGTCYYTRRGDFKDKDIVQARIDVATGRLLEPLRGISKGLVSDDTEGPHLYRIGEWYYLTMGEGGSRALHMQTIARSKSPWGPWEKHPGNPFVSQHNAWWHPTRCLGHVDLVDSPDGRWWAVALGTRHASYAHLSAIGRETFLFPVKWVDGWPVVEPAHLRSLTVEVETLPLHAWAAEGVRDEFDAARLGLGWTMIAAPRAGAREGDSPSGAGAAGGGRVRVMNDERFSLTERPGYLRLKGRPDVLCESTQVAFVGKRQTEHVGVFTMALEFSPANEGEEAGLAVFQTGQCHYALFKARRVGEDVIGLRRVVGNIVNEIGVMPAPAGPVELRVETAADEYVFSIAPAGGEFLRVGVGLSRLIATETADVWSGVLIGPYATGNGRESNAAADVGWVEYVVTCP